MDLADALPQTVDGSWKNTLLRAPAPEKYLAGLCECPGSAAEGLPSALAVFSVQNGSGWEYSWDRSSQVSVSSHPPLLQ